jgi:hypothetical protein
MRKHNSVLLIGIASLTYSALSSSAPAQVNACSLITAAEAAQILGKPALAKARVISTDDEDCGYLGSGFDIHTEVLPSVSGWSASRKKLIQEGKAESVEGVGEEAAFMKDGNGDYGIVARKGNRIVTVTMYASEGAPAELKPKLMKLITAAVAKVR